MGTRGISILRWRLAGKICRAFQPVDLLEGWCRNDHGIRARAYPVWYVQVPWVCTRLVNAAIRSRRSFKGRGLLKCLELDSAAISYVQFQALPVRSTVASGYEDCAPDSLSYRCATWLHLYSLMNTAYLRVHFYSCGLVEDRLSVTCHDEIGTFGRECSLL